VRALIDTGALIALARANDQYHLKAVAIARRFLSAGGRFVGTTLVLSELHRHLLFGRGPGLARAVMTKLLDDTAHEWTAVDADFVRDAIGRWLDRFADQPFSLTDAVSFELMRRERITHAFAFDRHFVTAGFELLV
jgi:predicted nucleic acid-binding protein